MWLSAVGLYLSLVPRLSPSPLLPLLLYCPPLRVLALPSLPRLLDCSLRESWPVYAKKGKGGQKTKRSKELTEETVRGNHNPRSAPTSKAGVERLQAVVQRVVLEETRPKSAPSNVETLQVSEPKSSVVSAEPSRLVSPKVGFGSSLSLGPSAGSSRLGTPTPETPPNPTEVGLALPSKRKSEEKPEDSRAEGVKAKGVQLLSEAANLGLRPNPGLRIGPPSPPIPEGATVRISIDLHGVLDLGAATEGCWSTDAKCCLANWLHTDRRHEAGVCSYIGLHGHSSNKRRSEAIRELHSFNQSNFTDLRLLITSDRDKPALVPEEVAVHIDDRLDLAVKLRERGVDTIIVNPNLHNPSKGFFVASSVAEAFVEIGRRRYIPKVYRTRWPGIFTSLRLTLRLARGVAHLLL